jgi:hypothetical protein
MKYLEMHKITMNLMGRSARSGKVRDDLMVANSGDDRTKGTMKFWLLKPPLVDSSYPDYLLGDALLPDLFMGLGMLCSDGAIEELWRASLVRWR